MSDTTILTVGWIPPYSIGHMPQDAGYVAEQPLTVPWTGKVSTYVLPYDLSHLTVTPGEPDPVVLNPPTGTGPAPAGPGTGAAPAPPSGTVRPPAAPRLTVPPRVAPVNFRSRGIRVRVTLGEPAKLELYATARVKKRLSRRRTTTVKRTITRKRTLRLPKGTTALRLPPSGAGRSAVGLRTRLHATVTMKARLSDGRLVTVNRAVLIARSTKS
jgi:hypothetical protein